MASWNCAHYEANKVVLGMEKCGKRNWLNSASESCTGMGVVAGFWAGMGMTKWPYLKRALLVSARRYLQIE